LDALFRIGDARVQYRVPRARSAAEAPLIPLSPREFLHGRPRARDKSTKRAPLTGHVDPPPRRRDPARARALGVLGLEADAEPAAVQRAFRRLAANVHPDRHPGANTSERARLMQQFVELSAAYHALVS
jgi:hypothetical protein